MFSDLIASSPPPLPAAETASQSPGAWPVHLPTGGAGGAPLIMAEDKKIIAML